MSYFAEIQESLVRAQHCQPILVIDRQRLDQNIDHVLATRPPTMDIRVVAKSLPSIDLLRHVMSRFDTDRLMTFNLPMLVELATKMPGVDQLLGKPFPVMAAMQFYTEVPLTDRPRVQWLIDTNERLRQYEGLAERLDGVLQVSLEIDVGLHRGGFPVTTELESSLRLIDQSPHLEFSGFVGYEVHLSKIPQGRLRDRAFDRAMALFREAVFHARAVFDEETCDRAIFNTAGSLTYPLHYADTSANEISLGTGLLKGTDFDSDLLAELVPAVFIAAPVLKVLESTRLPGLEFADALASKLGRPTDKALFIHGGHWMAEPVHPEGASNNRLYGRSSNQEMLNVAPEVQVAPDDFVFFRPNQTEATLMQFGPIAIYDNGEITDHWSVFSASA